MVLLYTQIEFNPLAKWSDGCFLQNIINDLNHRNIIIHERYFNACRT